jgi:hypothetical protein
LCLLLVSQLELIVGAGVVAAGAKVPTGGCIGCPTIGGGEYTTISTTAQTARQHQTATIKADDRGVTMAPPVISSVKLTKVSPALPPSGPHKLYEIDHARQSA